MEKQDFLEKQLRKTILELFGAMDEPTYSRVRHFFEWVNLPGGRHLFRQGDEGTGLYILASGRLKVQILQDEALTDINEVSPGETVGEMALMTGENRSADVLAMRDSVLAYLCKSDFEALVQAYPQALITLSKRTIERLQRNQHGKQRAKKKITNLCLLPISEGIDITDLASQLAAALSRYGTVLLLDSAGVGRLLDQPNIAQVPRTDYENYRKLTAWLEEQETNNDFVLYLPDADDTEWTHRCLRQADEVLLWANDRAAPALSDIEQKYLYGPERVTIAGQTLAILHPTFSQHPTNTALWVQGRKLTLHHHLRNENSKDFERLARILSNNAIGLVLSGGAARGIAHIGVFRALEEAGIEVDIIGGTSIGAVMGALYTFGWKADVFKAKARTVFKDNPTSDFSLSPWKSIFKGKKMEGLLREFFGDLHIEDLWINFFCVSCNLTQTDPRIHQRGPVAKVLRASISIPGVFPPAELENELYVDGGVFNNLPIDVMGRMGVGTIYAVDLQLYQLQNTQPVNKKRKMPNLLSVVMESSMLSGRYMTQQFKKDVDVYINPKLADIGIVDWHKFDKIEAIGYASAREALLMENGHIAHC
jgi:NTE family protein